MFDSDTKLLPFSSNTLCVVADQTENLTATLPLSRIHCVNNSSAVCREESEVNSAKKESNVAEGLFGGLQISPEYTQIVEGSSWHYNPARKRKKESEETKTLGFGVYLVNIFNRKKLLKIEKEIDEKSGHSKTANKPIAVVPGQNLTTLLLMVRAQK